MSEGITTEACAKALQSMTKHGIDPNSIVIPPGLYEELLKEFTIDITLVDGNKVSITNTKYNEYKNTYNEPEDDTLEQFKDRRMVLEL